MECLDEPLARELRAALDAVLAGGMATDLFAHAEQVAAIMTVLDRAFRAGGLRCVLVGGGAIEVQAPGVYLSHDIDIVVDGWHLYRRPRARRPRVRPPWVRAYRPALDPR
ncbi:hypothetical protein tb265_09080 [Gemmatimonadetes bacterium T265]|nr:hypothetical protein tb265_09080 [Gemmatimonadetes bacterium T265]